MQIFRICQNSVLPTLRVELINDGRYDYLKSYEFNNAIQNADVTFTMVGDNGKIKISKSPATIVLVGENTCEERYIIEYAWKKRDTNEKGQYFGKFEIKFKDDLTESGHDYRGGNLIMPIAEDLDIYIK